MKILSRYVLREFFVPLVYCTVGFFSIYLLFELFGSFSRLTTAKPGWSTAVLYLVGYLAPYVKWMMPACLMLATLYTMWNFCRHSEIVAMRASGIGFFAIVKPVVVVSALVALAVGLVNECFVPRYGLWAKQFKTARFKAEEMENVTKIDYLNAKGGRLWQIGKVLDAEATEFTNVVVQILERPGEKAAGTAARLMKITAPGARFMDGVWWFDNPKFEYCRPGAFERSASPSPELDALSLRAFPQFTERPRDFLLENRLLQNRDMSCCSTYERRRFLEMNENLPDEKRRGVVYDIWFQLLSPLACIVITLFAIPAGIATGRQSVFKGVLGALGMFFAFYALTILFMILSKKGWCPPLLAAVLPHVVFIGVGCHLFWRHR